MIVTPNPKGAIVKRLIRIIIEVIKNIPVIGVMNTRHFDFIFVAKTREKVVEEAEKAWQRHCEVYVDADPDLFAEYGIESEIAFVEVDKLPMAFRDYESI